MSVKHRVALLTKLLFQNVHCGGIGKVQRGGGRIQGLLPPLRIL